MADWEQASRFFWLVGLTEGEGTFLKPSGSNLPILEIEMNDRDIVARAASLMGSKLTSREREWFEKGTGKKVTRRTYRTRLRGYQAVWLMHRLRPYMGERRRAQITKALDNSILQPKRAAEIDVTLPFPLGRDGDFIGPRYEARDYGSDS